LDLVGSLRLASHMAITLQLPGQPGIGIADSPRVGAQGAP